MTGHLLDFRSDTVTQPTERMRHAMATAVVGDDILGEDPTVRRLEAMSAEMFGKEAGLFVISGTMANQVAIMALTQLGDEIIVGEDTHIYNLEVGGLAALSGVQPRPLKAQRGQFSPTDVRKAIRPKGIQAAVTRVLCLENTYNLNRGIPLSLAYMEEMAEIARAQGVSVYLDGARIFNAAVELNTSLAQLCRPADCLQFCLSKGLAAPVGSLILGSRATIERARWIRQRIGGGMRQAGHMAAAGIVALEEMLPRLKQDHDNATRLVEGLAAIDGRLVNPGAPRTNIVHIDFGATGRDAGAVVRQLLERNIKIKQIDDAICRMITHWGIETDDIDATLDLFREILRGV
jgi:threonine aldolase